MPATITRPGLYWAESDERPSAAQALKPVRRLAGLRKIGAAFAWFEGVGAIAQWSLIKIGAIPNDRYRNIRSLSRYSFHSGGRLCVLHSPRCRQARGGDPGTCASRVAGGGCDHNGRRNMVDALHRHARLHHADPDVLRHRIDRAFAHGGDLRHRAPAFTSLAARAHRRLASCSAASSWDLGLPPCITPAWRPCGDTPSLATIAYTLRSRWS